MANIVINKHGVKIDYDAAVNLMDDDIREQLARQTWSSDQDFFEAYAIAHKRVFGDEWELAKSNPVW